MTWLGLDVGLEDAPDDDKPAGGQSDLALTRPSGQHHRGCPARCPRCERELPVDQFAPDRSKASGRKSWCRACDNAKAKAYYARNREARAAWYARNREAILARRRARKARAARG